MGSENFPFPARILKPAHFFCFGEAGNTKGFSGKYQTWQIKDANIPEVSAENFLKLTACP